MRVLTTLLVLAGLIVAGAVAFIYSGLADVAATSPHWAVTRWVLSTTMEHSVRRWARQVDVPPPGRDTGPRPEIAADYDEMCAGCHGAPGIERGEAGKGLNPEPPLLVKHAADWTPSEIFWITKHGIRMTGMPAFGPTHSDARLWELVTFVKRLPQLSPAEYHALVASSTVEGGHAAEHEMEHAHGP